MVNIMFPSRSIIKMIPFEEKQTINASQIAGVEYI